MERLLEKNIEKLVMQADKMIPVEWNDIKLLGEVEEGRITISSIFYFREINQEEYIRSHDIPKKYGVSEKIYMEFAKELNNCVLAVYDATESEKKWDQLSLSITKQGKLDIDFRYDQMTLYGLLPSQRKMLWAYEECGYIPSNPALKKSLFKGIELKKSFERGEQ